MASPEPQHHDQHDSRPHEREKLKFFKSPVVGHSFTSDVGPHRHSRDGGLNKVPEFKRYEEPTLLEIFYDLFFAANYTVFSENREVTNRDTFKSYVGFFSILWLTWFVVTSFDVRFLTDSMFERTARAAQLGVLVGFAVVAPNFDPSDQQAPVMRTMSLILMLSRAVLAIEYASTLWHVRKFRPCRVPLALNIAINVASMFIYFGISFRFNGDKNSRVFVTWYIISAAEAILTLAISWFWPVMGFSQTHLIKRLTLLTVMMLGDGLLNIAKEVALITKLPDAWDARTIGAVTAGVAIIYFVFLIYFDWLRSSFYMAPARQMAWTFLHFPLHLSLVLFIQAFTQYIIWGKVMNVLGTLSDNLVAEGDPAVLAKFTSASAVENMRETVEYFFQRYPPKMMSLNETVQIALKNISSVPDTTWPLLASLVSNSENRTDLSQASRDAVDTVMYSILSIFRSLSNNIFQNFGIDVAKEIDERNEKRGKEGTTAAEVNSGIIQDKVDVKTWRRYRLVFAYGYISAGLSLIFMAALSIVSRTSPWKPWPVIRLGILVTLAIGTSCISVLWFKGPTTEAEEETYAGKDLLLGYLQTPWVLLTIFVVYTVVLVLTHIGGHASADPTKRSGAFFRKRAKSYEPQTPGQDWATKEQPDGFNGTDRSLSPYETRESEPASPATYDERKRRNDHHGPSDV